MGYHKLLFTVITTFLVVQEGWGQLEDGLLLHYPFSGSVFDASGNDFHGSGNAVSFGTDMFGMTDGALVSNGTSTFVDFPAGFELEPQLPVTLAARVYLNGLGQQHVFFCTDLSLNSHSGAWLQVNAQGRLVASYGNAQGGFNAMTRHGKASFATLQANQWYSVMAVIRGFNDIDLYIDCEPVAGQYSGSAQTMVYTDAVGSVCRKYANSIGSGLPAEQLDGKISDVMFWDKALTPEELAKYCPVCAGTLSVEDVQVCPGETFELGFEFSVSDDSEISAVEWSVNGELSDEETPAFDISQPGLYEVSLAVTTDANCIFQAFASVFVLSNPLPPSVSPTVLYCENQESYLDLGSLDAWDAVTDQAGNVVTQSLFLLEEIGVYAFTFEAACTSYTVEVEVFNPLQEVVFPLQSSLCEGTPFTFSIDLPDQLIDDISIFVDYGNGITNGLSDPDLFMEYEDAGDYHVSIVLAYEGCEWSLEGVVSVQVFPEWNLETQYILCPGDTLQFDFEDLGYDVFDPFGNQLTTFLTVGSGSYTFMGANSCGEQSQIVESILIDFFPQPFGQVQDLCPGQDTLAFGFHNDQLVIQWDNGLQQPALQTTNPGVFSAQIADSSFACSEQFVFEIRLVPYNPLVVFPEPVVELCTEVSNLLEPIFHGLPYTFPDGSTGFNYEVEESGTVQVTYTDFCYTYMDEVQVLLDDCLCPYELPNVFTPNGDARNDEFSLFVDCPVQDYLLEVFNRWGQQVFESRNIDRRWNGKLHNSGSEAAEGVYFFVVRASQLIDDLVFPMEESGTVTLMR